MFFQTIVTDSFIQQINGDQEYANCDSASWPLQSTLCTCSNGQLDTGETCDDRNVAPGDGCDGNCLIEDHWTCPTPGEPCTPICGDSLLIGTETCDDANSASGDGCSDICQIEEGYTCTGLPSVCQKCGDAVI
jgi:cysteine-rich repeat protein